MEKIVYKIVSFMVFLGFAIWFLGKCQGCAFDQFLTDLLDPTESVKDKDYITDQQIRRARPVELKAYCQIQLTKYNSEINNLNISNTNICQQVNSVNNTINNTTEVINQRINNNLTRIAQNALIQWKEENIEKKQIILQQYNNMNSDLAAIKTQVQQLKNKIASLKNAITQNTYDSNDENNVMTFGDYQKMKQEIIAQADKLAKKNEDLAQELNKSQKSLKALKRAVDSCTGKIEELNKKIDEVLPTGGDPGSGSQGGDQVDKEYYAIVGTKEELLEKGIITEVQIVGSYLKVSPDLNKNLFAIYNRTNRSLILGSDDYEYDVLSAIPEESYDFRNINDNTLIVIKDVDKFWSQTEFLVVVKTEKEQP